MPETPSLPNLAHILKYTRNLLTRDVTPKDVTTCTDNVRNEIKPVLNDRVDKVGVQPRNFRNASSRAL
jgi:hypothetical protein